MSRLKRLAAKLTKQKFKNIVIENGFIPLDRSGNYNYVLTQVNTENFNDLTEELIQQLNDSGKYNCWVSLIEINPNAPFSMNSLPIYGSVNSFITQWLYYTPEGAMDQDLSDRGMKLLSRANEYIQVQENNA